MVEISVCAQTGYTGYGAAFWRLRSGKAPVAGGGIPHVCDQ
jgi:hypothetical protein